MAPFILHESLLIEKCSLWGLRVKRERLRGKPEMLLNATNPLFQTLDAFLNLAVRELNERSGFLKLFIQIRSIIGMTPVEIHLEPSGHELKFIPEPFGQHTGVSLGIGNFSAKGPGQICPKGFSSGAD